MGELFDFAQQYSEEERNRQMGWQEQAAQERELNSRRAAEFVELMQGHNIPTSTLWKKSGPHDAIAFEEIGQGWIAVHGYVSYEYRPSTDIFVSEAGQSYFSEFDCRSERIVVKNGEREDRVLAERTTPSRIAYTLQQHGIV